MRCDNTSQNVEAPPSRLSVCLPLHFFVPPPTLSVYLLFSFLFQRRRTRRICRRIQRLLHPPFPPLAATAAAAPPRRFFLTTCLRGVYPRAPRSKDLVEGAGGGGEYSVLRLFFPLLTCIHVEIRLRISPH